MSSKATKFRETLVNAIRDIGHAYLALHDRNDWRVFATTIDAAYAALVQSADLGLMPRIRRESNIGRESALMMLAEAVRSAERALKELEALCDGPDEEAWHADAWIDTGGKQALQVIAVALNAILCESNVWMIVLRSNPQYN